ncbi:MAG: GerMN domain-containing protein [bacterium]
MFKKITRLLYLGFIGICLLKLGNQAYATSDSVPLVFYQQGEIKVVIRPNTAVFGDKALLADKLSLEDKATDILTALIAGPNEEEKTLGITSPIPSGTKLLKSEVIDSRLKVTLSKEFISSGKPFDSVLEYVNDQIIKTFTEYPELKEFYIYIEGEDGIVRLADDYTIAGQERLQKIAAGEFGIPQSKSIGGVVQPRVPTNHPTGILSGKRIGINPGHGWWYNPGYWALQRGVMYGGYIEDMDNEERCLNLIARYLWNAGAEVFPAREWDSNTTEVIVNNDSGSPSYTETGSWSTSASNGYNTTYRYAFTNTSATTATAIWQASIPRADYYAVYQFHRPGSNRVTDAEYIINHSGGQTIVYVNQKQRATTSDPHWIYMGQFYFNAGTVTITLTNFSKDTSGSVVIADAIRLGGGISQDSAIESTSSAMNKPRWQGAASYWTKYIGAPSDVYAYGGAEDSDDWYSRPGLAVWENCDGYLMIHTNAYGSGAHGTVSYKHTSSTTINTYPFVTTIHYQIIRDLRALWNASWYDRGIATGSYAEIGRIASAGIPGCMMELAFHDDTSSSELDNYALRNPKFNDIMCRAIYKGVCKYFSGSGAIILPLPPKNVRVVNLGSSTIKVTWSPQSDPLESTAIATAYRVYKSFNGKGFDNGTYTTATTLTLSGLAADSVYYFQIAAVNAGGESFPSETLAARVNPKQTTHALLVNGYTRIDTSIGIDRSDPYYPKVNQTFDYIIQHASALANATTTGGGKVYFDSASRDVVNLNLIQLNLYDMVDWIAGQQSTADTTFTATEQTQIQNLFSAGGKLFVSGAEIGYDLYANGSGSDQTFYQNYLDAAYIADDAGSYTVTGQSGGIFNGLSGIMFDAGYQGTYNVAYPDAISVTGVSLVNLSYGGTSYYAGIQSSTTNNLVYFGFPFETIYPESSRNQVMQRIVSFLLKPRLQVTKPNMYYFAFAGKSNPASKTITISNNGFGTMYWTASSSQNWLICSPNSGTVAENTNTSAKVGINITGLSYGRYTAQLTVSSSNGENSPQTITVILVVAPVNIVNSYGYFTTSSDTSYWFYQLYADGINTGTLSWVSSMNSVSITQVPGEKSKISQVFSVPSSGWYTAETRVCSSITDSAKQQKVYLYLQEFDDQYQIKASGNQVVYSGAGGLTAYPTWKPMQVGFYTEGTNVSVQVVAINPSDSNTTASLYIDDILVYPNAYQPEISTGLTNASFDSGTTGWLMQPYGDAGTAGIWTTASSNLILAQDGGNKGKASQLFRLQNYEEPTLSTLWVYSDATAKSQTQKIYLYLYSYSSGYNKIIESGNAVLYAGKWTPGEWHQIRIGYIPMTDYNVVQLVGINPAGNSWASLYFDGVEVKSGY